ncbi:ABC transporter arginine-binding protein 1-like [Amphiura filiformis]|uniref:ABC transporter arginine-binding protein 1-like n=1 Tax=Amphiura filiformis TaxID=82378 RepID=UPI003B21C32D
MGDSGSYNNLPTILSVLALVIGIIAVIMAAVSVSQKETNNFIIGGGDKGGAQSDAMNDDDRIWVIAIGHAADSVEYIDEISGQIKGFDVDMVNAVCRIAGKNCRFSVDVYTRCWDSEVGETQRGGVGLYSGFYDACTGWYHTYGRDRTFQFSDPFSTVEAIEVGFLVKPGNPRNFTYRDIRGKKIGFLDGHIPDEYCVARQDNIQGVPIPPENVIHYPNHEQLVAGIQNGEIDAGFDFAFLIKSDMVEVIPGFRAQCAIAGQSMMMRKDNTLWEWWNPAFAKLRASPEYKRICQDLLEQHGHIPGPSPEEHCFDYN